MSETLYLSIPAAEECYRRVSSVTGIAMDDLLGDHHRFAPARWLVAREMRRRHASYPMIAKRMQRDPASIQYGLRQLPLRIAKDGKLAAWAQELADEHEVR